MDFSDFFRAEADSLLRFCWVLTLDADDARDLAQEVMERAWKDWDKLGIPQQNPEGWIRTVAVNLSRTRWRRIRRFRALTPAVATQVAHRETASDPDLLGALELLAPRQRQAVALRYWSDLSLQECASTMGVTLGSVKQHLARAHRNLATTLDPTTIEGLLL